jgi:adenylate cyclase
MRLRLPDHLPWRRWPGLRLRVRDKLALWFGAVMALVTALAVGMSYSVSVRTVVGEFGGKLETVAAGAALGIDGDRFAALREPEQMDSAEYRQIQAHLRRFRDANSHIRFRYFYTMAPTEKPGVWRYVVDTEAADSEEFSALGDEEDFTKGDIILDAFRTGKPAADRDVKMYPGWGSLLSAAAPIRNGAGQVVGIVGVDAPAVAVRQTQEGLRRTALVCLLAGLLVAAGASTLAAWGFTRPLTALIRGTEAVRAGDFNHRVSISNRDELGQLAHSFNEMIQGLRQRDLYKEQFERYVSRQIAEKILAEPERDFWHGERRRTTVLFADIRGFTSMSERLPPEEVVSRLNEYLRVMIDIIFEYEGTLDKFIGDAIMAVFGAPISLGNDEERAVRAALAMQEAADDLCRRWEEEGRTSFRVGIGINTGEVVVGNIGSERRLEYAAIGDHVNLAARMETLTKEYDTDILISEHTYQAVKDLVETRWVDRVTVRGRSEAVDVYEVCGLRAVGAAG